MSFGLVPRVGRYVYCRPHTRCFGLNREGPWDCKSGPVGNLDGNLGNGQGLANSVVWTICAGLFKDDKLCEVLHSYRQSQRF